jgi:hypothetical protein
MMKNMKEKGMMRYDFVGYTNYKHSMVKSDTQATLQLPLQNSRAKSVLCLPLDSSSYTAQERIEDDDASAFKGILDGITEYRFNVDQKLNPDRPVPLGKISDSIEQQYLIELEKGLSQSGIQPTSFRHFASNFCISRALAFKVVDNFVYFAVVVSCVASHLFTKITRLVSKYLSPFVTIQANHAFKYAWILLGSCAI